MSEHTEQIHEKPKAYVALSPIGVFAFSDNNQILYFELFEKDPEKALKQFDQGIKKDFLDKLSDYDIECSEKSNDILRKKIRDLSSDLKFAENDEEFNSFLSRFCYKLTQARMKFSFSKDKFIIQANNALEDLQRILGLMSERLKEWFTLHYPESRLSQKQLVEFVSQYGKRENFPDFEDSVGLNITEEDEFIIKSYATHIRNLNDQRREMENYVKKNIQELCPNTSTLIDELLLARMISSAGSIEKLSRLSASSIQLLGAEKALFRHLRKHGKSPKYGLIFMSHHIQNAPEEIRGKIARILSAKMMQAIRIDFYSGRDEKERINNELNEEIKKAIEK